MLLQRRLHIRAAPVVLLSLDAAAAGGLLRHDDIVHRGRRIAQRWRRCLRVFLEERIGGERLLHLLGELERRHLEKLQRLLDLWREREMLSKP